MRLVVWNCCERFGRNYPHLRDLDFDVAVVTECGPFEPGLDDRQVTSVLRRAIEQPGHTKHIGVLARAPWSVAPMPPVDDQPWLLPVRVTGPVDLTVLAVWALGREWTDDRLTYARQTGRTIADVLPSLAGPVVLAGDLNAPVALDRTSTRQHEDNVGQLSSRGLVSAFTAARVDVDPLSEPTLYHQRKADQGFHIDHAFVPVEWTDAIAVSVGTYDEWVDTGRSDHVPLVVDLQIP